MQVPRQLEEQLSLERVVGRGSFSTVYKACWWRPGATSPETVSIKALLPQYCSPRSTSWTQFIAEGSFLQQCDHQHVLKCHGLLLLPPDLPGLKDTYTSPVLAMVLEYIKGGTLLDWLTSQLAEPYHEVYSLHQALGVLADTAEGLAHLHERRPAVVHRDLKPGNILLHKLKAADHGRSTSGRELLTVRIADFGLHAVMDDTRNVSLRRSSTAEATGSSTVDSSISNTFHVLASTPTGGRLRPSDLHTVHTSQLEELLLPATASRTQDRIDASRMKPSAAVMERCSEPGPVAASAFKAKVAEELCRLPSPPWSDGPPRCTLLKISASAIQLCQQQHEDAPWTAKSHLLPAGDSSALDAHLRSDLSDSSSSSSSGDVQRGQGKATHNLAALGLDSLPGNQLAGDKLSNAAPSQQLLDPFLPDSRLDAEGGVCECVFDLTEDTGSVVYMAPEVRLKLPYNSKADVYSFGVLMYELLGRTLLARTVLWENKIRDADDYLKRVGSGWRPRKARSIPPQLWHLVQACWHGDPNRRPCLSHVALQLRALMADPTLLHDDGGANGQRAHDCCIIS